MPLSVHSMSVCWLRALPSCRCAPHGRCEVPRGSKAWRDDATRFTSVNGVGHAEQYFLSSQSASQGDCWRESRGFPSARARVVVWRCVRSEAGLSRCRSAAARAGQSREREGVLFVCLFGRRSRSSARQEPFREECAQPSTKLLRAQDSDRRADLRRKAAPEGLRQASRLQPGHYYPQ